MWYLDTDPAPSFAPRVLKNASKFCMGPQSSRPELLTSVTSGRLAGRQGEIYLSSGSDWRSAYRSRSTKNERHGHKSDEEGGFIVVHKDAFGCKALQAVDNKFIEVEKKVAQIFMKGAINLCELADLSKLCRALPCRKRFQELHVLVELVLLHPITASLVIVTAATVTSNTTALPHSHSTIIQWIHVCSSIAFAVAEFSDYSHINKLKLKIVM